MRATEDRNGLPRAFQRALPLAIGVFAMALPVAAQVGAFPRVVRAQQQAAPRWDVNLVCLEGSQPVAGAVVTVSHLGATYQNLRSDQYGLVRRPGTAPDDPTLGAGFGNGPCFLGAGEQFHVVAQHPSAGVVVRTFNSYVPAAGDCPGCGYTAVTYRVDFGGKAPARVLSPELGHDPEPDPTGEECSPPGSGTTKIVLEYETLRTEDCKDPFGIPVGCTHYLCGQSPAWVGGEAGHSSEHEQRLTEQISAEAQLTLGGFGLLASAGSSSEERTRSTIRSNRTHNWRLGQPLAQQYACQSGEVCMRTKIVTLVFRQIRYVCQAQPGGGGRWRRDRELPERREIPVTVGTCTDMSGLADDPLCCKRDAQGPSGR